MLNAGSPGRLASWGWRWSSATGAPSMAPSRHSTSTARSSLGRLRARRCCAAAAAARAAPAGVVADAVGSWAAAALPAAGAAEVGLKAARGSDDREVEAAGDAAARSAPVAADVAEGSSGLPGAAAAGAVAGTAVGEGSGSACTATAPKSSWERGWEGLSSALPLSSGLSDTTGSSAGLLRWEDRRSQLARPPPVGVGAGTCGRQEGHGPRVLLRSELPPCRVQFAAGRYQLKAMARATSRPAGKEQQGCRQLALQPEGSWRCTEARSPPGSCARWGGSVGTQRQGRGRQG